ncbi:MAG: hypothetical protein ACK5HY_17335 [Parahaliea sp.]
MPRLVITALLAATFAPVQAAESINLRGRPEVVYQGPQSIAAAPYWQGVIRPGKGPVAPPAMPAAAGVTPLIDRLPLTTDH